MLAAAPASPHHRMKPTAEIIATGAAIALANKSKGGSSDARNAAEKPIVKPFVAGTSPRIGISHAYAANLPANKRCSTRPAVTHKTAAKQSPAAHNEKLTITAFCRIRPTSPRPKSRDNP